MSFEDNQKQVHAWVSQFKPAYWPIHQQLAHLIEEVGELGREINHKYGIKKKKASEKPGSIEEQLAEITFVLCCMANSSNISLDEQWEKMMQERQYKRDVHRFEKKK
ncbi:MAG: nucleotide pyrophosphohydrolase [Candidatus Pacearchaeota archaeon]|jgi:NTP pyrophosphatase (non-canonical NTP hydrolase)